MKEEISRHSKNNIGCWPVQINGNNFATGQILGKPVEVVKWRILAGWAEKSPEPYDDQCWINISVGDTTSRYTISIEQDN
jgi:hypothetical protein